MSLSERISGIRETAEEAAALVTRPEILAVLLATQAACERKFDSTEFVTDEACASELISRDEDADDISSSDRVALSENGYVGYAKETNSGVMCTVVSMTAWDPDTLENLSGDKIEKLLEHNLITLAFEGGSTYSRAADEERLGEAYLGDSVEDFGLGGRNNKGGNIFAAVCPTQWDGPSAFVVTDLCRYIVPINGDSSSVVPDVPECIDTDPESVDICD